MGKKAIISRAFCLNVPRVWLPRVSHSTQNLYILVYTMVNIGKIYRYAYIFVVNYCRPLACIPLIWWRHQMETVSALLAICAGNSPVTGEFTSQRPVTRSFDVFFDLCLNKRLSKQLRGWWFEKLSRPLWRHCNDLTDRNRQINWKTLK